VGVTKTYSSAYEKHDSITIPKSISDPHFTL
jgi:hypothetical protein